jgi:hypothetical protein
MMMMGLLSPFRVLPVFIFVLNREEERETGRRYFLICVYLGKSCMWSQGKRAGTTMWVPRVRIRRTTVVPNITSGKLFGQYLCLDGLKMFPSKKMIPLIHPDFLQPLNNFRTRIHCKYTVIVPARGSCF